MKIVTSVIFVLLMTFTTANAAGWAQFISTQSAPEIAVGKRFSPLGILQENALRAVNGSMRTATQPQRGLGLWGQPLLSQILKMVAQCSSELTTKDLGGQPIGSALD